MSTITLRATKGSPLTNTEVDNNFSNLNTDKIESTYSGAMNSLTGGSSITTVSSTTGITTGAWKASVIGAAYGGTGVANGATSTITLGGALTLSGAYATTLTITGITSVTLPTSGTLITSSVTSLSSLATVGTITSGTWNGSTIGTGYGGTGLTSFNSGGLIYASSSSALTSSSSFVFDGTNLSIGSSANITYDNVAAARPLLVQSSSTTTTLGSSTNALTISNSDTTTNNISQINFAAITGANSYQFSSAWIAAIHGARTNGQYPTGQLVFATSTTTNAAPSEKMRITSAGGISFGSGGTSYGTSGQVLTSNGNAAPTWQTAAGGISTGKAIAMAMVFGG